MTQYLHLQPHDPLLFGSGKPFSMGEETSLEGEKLPPGSTVWGALYSHLLLRGLVSTTEADRKKLRIQAVYLYHAPSQSLYVPTPVDVYQDQKGRVHPAAYLEAEAIASSAKQLGYPYFLCPDTQEKVESAAGTWMSLLDLRLHYPSVDQQVFNRIALKAPDAFAGVYAKTGIARSNASRTSEEGLLYRINMTEYAPDWGFVIAYELAEGLVFPKQGIVKLGGDAKTASFYCLEEIPSDLHQWQTWQQNQKTNLVKLYFQSPGILHEAMKEAIEAADFTSQAVALPRPKPLGGFDMKQAKPKPMERTWPAGTIFVLSYAEEKPLTELQSILSPIIHSHAGNQNGKGHFLLIPITETRMHHE